MKLTFDVATYYKVDVGNQFAYMKASYNFTEPFEVDEGFIGAIIKGIAEEFEIPEENITLISFAEYERVTDEMRIVESLGDEEMCEEEETDEI